MMTGNFLLLALSIGTGTFFSDGGHFMIAIAAFTVGAFIGGLFVNLTRDKGQFQRTGFVVEWVVLVAACILAINTEPTVNNASGITLVVMLAFCMGIQNAIVRSFSVPDLATNVMTLTFTAIIAESKAAKGGNKNVERRIGSVLIFMCSAILGALLLRWHMTYPIILATLLFTIALYPLLFGHHEACKH